MMITFTKQEERKRKTVQFCSVVLFLLHGSMTGNLPTPYFDFATTATPGLPGPRIQSS